MAALVVLNPGGGEEGGGGHSMKSYKGRLHPKVQHLILT